MLYIYIDFVSALTIREPPLPDTESSRSEYIFYTVSSTFDRWLIPDVKNSPYCKGERIQYNTK